MQNLSKIQTPTKAARYPVLCLHDFFLFLMKLFLKDCPEKEIVGRKSEGLPWMAFFNFVFSSFCLIKPHVFPEEFLMQTFSIAAREQHQTA